MQRYVFELKESLHNIYHIHVNVIERDAVVNHSVTLLACISTVTKFQRTHYICCLFFYDLSEFHQYIIICLPVIILRSNTNVSVDGESSATLYCRKVAVIGTMSPLSSS